MPIQDTLEALKKLDPLYTIVQHLPEEGHTLYIPAAGLRGLAEAFEAAVRYIELTPCDPDVTAAQWEAYERYVELVRPKTENGG